MYEGWRTLTLVSNARIARATTKCDLQDIGHQYYNILRLLDVSSAFRQLFPTRQKKKNYAMVDLNLEIFYCESFKQQSIVHLLFLLANVDSSHYKKKCVRREGLLVL